MQIIKRYQTRQSSVEDITEALWGAKVSSSIVSELNQKIYSKIKEWRQQPIQGEYPYIFWMEFISNAVGAVR